MPQHVKNAGYVRWRHGRKVYCRRGLCGEVPEGLDSAAASSITCAGVTTYKAVKISLILNWPVDCHLRSGRSGVIWPCSTRETFQCESDAIDVNDGQLKLAEEMGADLTINSRTEDAAKIVQEKPVARAAVVTVR